MHISARSPHIRNGEINYDVINQYHDAITRFSLTLSPFSCVVFDSSLMSMLPPISSKLEQSKQILFPLKSSENHKFSDDFRGIEVNQFASIHLILELKFDYDPFRI